MATDLNSTSWAPPNESASDLFAERTNLSGGVLGAIAYGIFLTIAFQCYQLMFNKKVNKSVPWGSFIFISCLLTFSTIYLGATTRWMEQMFIDYRNFHLDNVTTDPEATGPLGFYFLEYNTHMVVLGNAAYVVLNFLSDGFVLYRCYVIWNYNKLVMIFPSLIFLASTGMSILTVHTNSLNQSNFFGPESMAFATTWSVLTMSLNIILCGLIAVRLISSRNKLAVAYGPERAKHFTTVGAIVVESAALYMFFSLLFLIFFKMTNTSVSFVNIVLPLLTQSMCIAPSLIVLRMARRQAYSRETIAAVTSGVATRDEGSTQYEEDRGHASIEKQA